MLAYAEKASEAFRERKVAGRQGTEKHDNLGLGEHDHSFIDTDESQDLDDYSEAWDFARCIRGDGTMYGIASGKKCRKGTDTTAPTKREAQRKTKKEKIQKRGETSLKRATAEKVLDQLKQEGKREKTAEQRRAKGDGFGRSRSEQLQVLIGKAQKNLDQLEARRNRVKDGSILAKRLDARINRLQGLMGRLQEGKQRLRDMAPQQKTEGFGKVPKWATEGRSLA